MPTFAIGFKCEPADEGMEPLRMEFLGSMAAELLAGESSALYTRLYEQGLIDADFAIDYERMKGLAFLEASGDSDDPEAVLGGDPGRGEAPRGDGDRPRTVLAAEKVDAGPEAARAGQL